MATKKAPAKKPAVAKKASTKKVAPKKVAAKKPVAKKKVAVKKTRSAPPAKNVIAIEVETKGETFKFKVAPDEIGTIFEDMGLSSTNTQTIVRATLGKKTVEKVYNVHMARRLFRHNIARIIFAKNVRMSLGL